MAAFSRITCVGRPPPAAFRRLRDMEAIHFEVAAQAGTPVTAAKPVRALHAIEDRHDLAPSNWPNPSIGDVGPNAALPPQTATRIADRV